MEEQLQDASEEAFVGGRWWPRRAWEVDPAVAERAVKRVLVLGDIHNSDGVLRAALRIAERERCDAVVSVGDFWLQDCSLGHPDPDALGGIPVDLVGAVDAGGHGGAVAGHCCGRQSRGLALPGGVCAAP